MAVLGGISVSQTYLVILYFSQTGKTFFFKYPTLYQFLLDELSEATENIGTQLHPGLYPILMVLGRLFPSTMEGTDTALNLGAFIPFVVK